MEGFKCENCGSTKPDNSTPPKCFDCEFEREYQEHRKRRRATELKGLEMLPKYRWYEEPFLLMLIVIVIIWIASRCSS